MGNLDKSIVYVILLTTILFGGTFTTTPIAHAQQEAKLVETVELNDVRVQSGEVIVLLDVTDLGTIDTVHVAANLPCNENKGPIDGAGNDIPDVKIIAGDASTGNFGDVIESSSDDTGFVGIEKTCVFHDTVSSTDIPGGIITDIVLRNAGDKDVKLKKVVVTISINDPSGIASITSLLGDISTEVTNIEAKLDSGGSFFNFVSTGFSNIEIAITNAMTTIIGAISSSQTAILNEIGVNGDGKTSFQIQLLLLALPDFTTTIDSVGDVGKETSIAIGDDGLPVISYRDRTNNDLKVAHCGNIACTSATLSTVDSVSSLGAFTSIAIGDDGLPVISYSSDTGGTIRDLKVAHCNDVACTSATSTTLDNSANVGRATSIAIGDDGLPVISYFIGLTTDFTLKVAHCNDVACTSATLSTLDNIGGEGRYTSIAIGDDGLPVISYFHQTDTELKVAHCDDVACTSATLETVDNAVNVGRNNSIAIGDDGLPVISYRDLINNALKVAHCDDVACTSATLITLDTPNNLFGDTSIAIDDDGLPVISYVEFISSDRNLAVAHCNDVACTSAIFSTLDSPGDVGRDSSIAIGVDGLPVISYLDNTVDTNTDLKVAHCNDLACSPP